MGIAAATSSLALLAAPAIAAPSAPSGDIASASSGPALIWQDVTSLGVTCLVHTANGIDTGALHDRLCDAVRAQAAKGAPVPVVAAPLGGAALAPGRVTLLVQATVDRVGGTAVMAVTIRPFRNSADGGQLFGAAPRVVAADDRTALEAAVAALVAETVPWRSRPGGARPRPAS